MVLIDLVPPLKILTDHGSEFDNELFKSIFQTFEIKKLWTIGVSSPMYGLNERLNVTLKNSILKYAEEHLNNWDEYTQQLFGCRVTHHSTLHIVHLE